MIDGGVIELDAQISALGFHFVSCEVGAVISDDVVWNSITVYDPGYEVYHWSGFGRFNWFSFYPFSELVHHDQ